MEIKALKVNAFTESLHGGNPAGVVLDSPFLTDEQMKQVSKELSVSETAFVFPSNVADFKVRFFSPTIEVNLCGHATIATYFSMAVKGMLPPKKDMTVTQETKAGILPVHVDFNEDMKVNRVMMTQAKPIYKNIHINISLIADVLNVSARDIDDSFPKQIVSTGLFTLPIGIKSYDALKNIHPDFENVKKLCERIGAGSMHVFTFETIEPKSLYHARNFAPVYGVNEDPVTGTANGAVCSYLIKHKIIEEKSVICEQGDIIGRPGRVFVEMRNDIVRVGGRAKIVQEKTIDV
jgi:trans-2,3-dihydro-3-hydroxyanthranilate isomerase